MWAPFGVSRGQKQGARGIRQRGKQEDEAGAGESGAEEWEPRKARVHASSGREGEKAEKEGVPEAATTSHKTTTLILNTKR